MSPPSYSAALKRALSEAAVRPEVSIGSAVRERRRRLGLTLQALAAASDLSAPFLSQLERGLTTPSITSLMGVAKALGVDISYFISVPHSGRVVRRAGDPQRIEVGSEVEYQRLSGDHEERKMEALLMVVPPGVRAPTARRDGEGFWYVLEGELEVRLGEADSFVLGAGDSAHFDQRHPYTMANLGPRAVRMLWVGTPALF